MEAVPNDILLLIYPELHSHRDVKALSKVNYRFHAVFQANKARILKRVYARNFAITHPGGHQDSFRLARYMLNSVVPPIDERIPVSQLSMAEIAKIQENNAVIKFLEDRFLVSRRESRNKARREVLSEHEQDKFVQATARFWLFCLVFAEDPRNRAGQKAFVEAWCYHSGAASELQYIREIILFQWRLLRDALPEEDEEETHEWARKMGMRCFAKSQPPDHTSDTQWIEFILSRGPAVLVDIVKEKSLLRRMYYLSQSPFANRLDAAQYTYICGHSVSRVMQERSKSLAIEPRGILDR